MYLYLLCFVLFVLRFCVVSFMYIICFVCTSVRTTATEWKLNCINYYYLRSLHIFIKILKSKVHWQLNMQLGRKKQKSCGAYGILVRNSGEVSYFSLLHNVENGSTRLKWQAREPKYSSPSSAEVNK